MSDDIMSIAKTIAEALMSLAGISASLAAIAAALKGILILLTILTAAITIFVASKVMAPIIRAIGHGLNSLRRSISRRRKL